MKLSFNTNLLINYKSETQKIRVMSETWIEENIFCSCCGNSKLKKFVNNKPLADFYCPICEENFELKSKNGKVGKKINGGAYETTIKRINSNANPNLLVLQYTDYTVVNLEMIPKYFFTPDLIEPRKPLSENARRVGWKGSNILFWKIPKQGRISIIKDKKIINRKFVVSKYRDTKLLQVNDIKKRGWLFDILSCINSIKNNVFTLDDVYKFENQLQEKHINNNNIRPKIRQQLQLLRDKGYIEFLGDGLYRKIN